MDDQTKAILEKLNELAQSYAKTDGKVDGFSRQIDQKIDALSGRTDAKIDAMGKQTDVKIAEMGKQTDAKIAEMGKQTDAKIDAISKRTDEKIAIFTGEIKRHFGVLVENLDDQIKLIAEGHIDTNRRLDGIDNRLNIVEEKLDFVSEKRWLIRVIWKSLKKI
jgi:hypothetical protein